MIYHIQVKEYSQIVKTVTNVFPEKLPDPCSISSPPEQTKHSTLKTSPTTTLCSGNPGLYHTFYISIWAAWCTMFFVNALSKLPRCPEIWVRSVPRLNRAQTDKIGGGKKNDCCVELFPVSEWIIIIRMIVNLFHITVQCCVCVTASSCAAFCNTKARSGSKFTACNMYIYHRHRHRHHHINKHHHRHQIANVNRSRVRCTWFWHLAESHRFSELDPMSQKLLQEKVSYLNIDFDLHIFFLGASQNSTQTHLINIKVFVARITIDHIESEKNTIFKFLKVLIA